MGALYQNVLAPYMRLRSQLSTNDREQFDDTFLRWLFHVFDPLDALAVHFDSRRSEGATRMRRGTASRAEESEVLSAMAADWQHRQYGPEERPWLAWLLRFGLPEEAEPQNRFREVPCALPAGAEGNHRWTHVAIDEAQDLSVAEASLLGSLVDPNGALTISADFRQVVSPVHGMTNADAFHIGSPFGMHRQRLSLFPFAKNMRQSREMGLFLRAFHEVAFGEVARFNASDRFAEAKPRLVLAPAQDYALRIRQAWNVFQRSKAVTSVALLQINEDEQVLSRLRQSLVNAGVVLAPIWAASGEGLLTTSVERIKGLEFDAAVVLGLEDVDRSALNFVLNRAYVALSRPSLRLVILCSEFPALLAKIDRSLFNIE